MELNDKIIFKVALITSLVGIIGMLVFASYIEPKEIQIKDITETILEKL